MRVELGRLHCAQQDELKRLRIEQPAIAATLMTNIAQHLSERLRHAAAAWRLTAA